MTSQPLSWSLPPLYRQYHTHSFYDITLAICVASCALYATSHPNFLTSNHHFEDIILTILDIVSIVSESSHQIYWWYHSHYMYDITSTICETFYPQYLWHRIHYVRHDNAVCWLHHTRPLYDIICATEDVKYTLSHQATIYMTSHPLQAWHHTPCIWHRTNCTFVINLSTDIRPTFVWHDTHYCVASYALYRASYPLLMSSPYCT